MSEKNQNVAKKEAMVQKPLVILLLGLCPAVAMTSSVLSALGIAGAVLAIILLSNLVLWALRPVIPAQARVPAALIVSAFFTTVAQMTMNAWLPDIYGLLGVYLAVLAVNLLVFHEAEETLAKRSLGKSLLSALGTGVVFAAVLFVTAFVREILGSASFAGMEIAFLKDYTIPMLTQIPGGLLTVGLMAAALQAIWPCRLSGAGVAFDAVNMKQEAQKQ